MTREMNKPEWHNKWVFFDKEIEMKEYLPIKRERTLNPDIAEFVEYLNRSLTNVGKR